jgi:mannose-1-phosphate guanylyltransferase / mannose-6-phosphate isomerase
MIIPVILSGGSGTRLWPLSRALYPKQLITLVSERTMLQETVLRVESIEDRGPVYCICNENHRFLVAEQLREIGTEPGAIVLEPFGRNTAPAAAVAAMMVAAKHPDALMLLMPADHVVPDVRAFVSAVNAGMDAARAGRLVTFGIVPDSAETGYGYIKAGDEPMDASGAFPVLEFVEKPDLQAASLYLASGDYYWNSGIFLFRPESYLGELEKMNSAILLSSREALLKAREDLDFIRLDAVAFESCPSDSIDYAVMEKTSKASLVRLDAGWSDVGAWSELWELQQRDEEGNVKKGDVVVHDVRNSYIQSTHRLVAAIGLEGHIVVETADAVLVASKSGVHHVRKLVEELQKKEREEVVTHRRVYRPWGFYETVDFAERFKVKRITVKPGASLSLQMHRHRAEHWIVVRGKAHVTLENRQIVLEEDQSAYIPVGVYHRLENREDIPLDLIEVQSGSYLGEDDIIRVEDRYGRL